MTVKIDKAGRVILPKPISEIKVSLIWRLRD
jgi:hypothetical protein